MSGAPERVVFDCNIYFQALINPDGPSARCVVAAARGQVALFCSEHVVAELADVAGRPRLRAKFGLTDERIERLLEVVRDAAEFVDKVPEVFTLERDPDDSHYINLALATGSKYVVSRDNDLLDLVTGNAPRRGSFERDSQTWM